MRRAGSNCVLKGHGFSRAVSAFYFCLFRAGFSPEDPSEASMQAFEYASATKKEQVAALLGDQGAILAGGTDLLALMKDDVVTPKRLVNVKHIDGLRGITYQPGNGLRIGALTTIAEFAEDSNVRQHYPVLAEAAIEAASPQIRNLATMGGNMCQRPRCWYFRNGMGLLAKAPRRQVDGGRRRQPLRRHSRQRRPGIFRQPIDHRSGAHRLWREDPHLLGEGQRAPACANCRWRSSSSSPPPKASASTT